MQSAIAKTNSFVDSTNGNSAKKKLEFTSKKLQLVCPKPRRPVPSIPEVLKPLRCSKHRYSSSPNSNWKTDIVNMIEDKANGNGHECIACSTPNYSGSPPGRTHNPLIHDDEFIHQMEILSSPYKTTIP